MLVLHARGNNGATGGQCELAARDAIDGGGMVYLGLSRVLIHRPWPWPS